MYKLSLKESLPIAFGYFIVAFAFGVSCVDYGLPIWFPIAISFFVYAGAAQFAFLALYVSGASIITIVITTFLINLRHMLMSVYMGNHFRNLTWNKIHKILYGSMLTDESFAFHSLHNTNNLFNPKYYISFNIYCHISWSFGALTGALTYYYFNSTFQLDINFALSAMMLYVLISLITDKLKFIVAIVSIGIGIILKFTINSYIDIFIATFIATGVGLWLLKKH